MPVTPQEFHELKGRVAALEASVSILQQQLNASDPTSIEGRIELIEAVMTSVNQVAGVKQSLENDIESHDSRLTSLEKANSTIRTAVSVLNRARVDMRNEIKFSQATGGPSVWTLPTGYDPASIFIVFQSSLTLVDPQLIILSDPAAGVFESAVVLTNDVYVIYLGALDG